MLGTAVAGLLVASAADPAQAASSFTRSGLGTTVNGSSVTARVTLKASPAVTASRFTVCARSSAGAVVDFPYQQNTRITTTGTAYSGSRSFSAGSYVAFACVQVGTQWSAVGDVVSFTVGGALAGTTGTMPTGDLPGWRQVFKDDFATSAGRGSLLSNPAYSRRWYSYSGYNDTSGRGRYNPAAVMSTTGGALDWYVHTAGGQHNVAAMVPINPSTGWGQRYGRYSVRFRSDQLPGYKLAFMLWPDSDNWGEGEVDFPEVGSLEQGNRIYANLYQRGNTATGTPGPSTGFRTTTDAAGSGWHVATTEWSPNKLTYYLDGKALGTLTTGVPTTSFHPVLQVETAVGGPSPSSAVSGHVQVDWVTMYAYAP
ncbi:Glycosyl hydrolases family 16 [Friedmanniella luteola]|uniref:Glycosyl hydrolases family 16 n=2 Tax=Friedmanniella luteola TaxID=546871 RepID=A0A1H1YCZ9_9ACTN|nr:Glycosyl hydrolases family 16 [Friedmanniella luteola]